MCGGRCKGCCGCPEFRAWHEGSAQAIPVEVRWPALGMVVEVIQAVPVKTWTIPDEVVYRIEYRGRVYALNGDQSSGKHYIEIGE